MSDELLHCRLADTFGGNPEVQRRNDRAVADCGRAAGLFFGGIHDGWFE